MNKRVKYSNEILPEIQNEAQNFDVLKNTDDSELFFILKAKEAMVNDWESMRIPKGKMLRVAAYIRVSTESEQQKDSYDIQRSYFLHLISSHPSWIPVGIYSDYGISGTSREGRRGFNRLLRHCREGRIDRIVTKSISRFARNTRDFLKALEVLKENDVTIVFEKEHIDTAIVQNDMMLTAFGAVAQEESRSIAENIRWGIRHHFPRGETRNAAIYGYCYAEGENAFQTLEGGYTFRRIQVVEEEAGVVRRIFQGVSEGRTYMEIVRELNLAGIPAPESAKSQMRRQMKEAPKGVLKPWLDEGWTIYHIAQIVQQERYCGDVLLQKTFKPDYKSHRVLRNRGELAQYYVQNHHPAIVSRELFEEVRKICEIHQDLYGGNKNERRTYPFSGRLVCTHCGRFYHTRNRQGRPIWQCSSTRRNTGKTICSAEKIYEEQLVRMCRRAVIERFQITEETLEDCVQKADIFSGYYTALDTDFRVGSESIVKELLMQIEQIQNMDHMEQDVSVLKDELSDVLDRIEGEKQMLEILEGTDASEGIRPIRSHLKKDIQTAENLQKQIHYMEAYWTELEKDREWREKAILWMHGLPEGKEGLTAFLNGLTHEYVKAFIISIEIETPLKYRVRWFDDVWSDVKMCTNIK